MKYAFELNHLTRKFGSVTALDGVSLAIPPGSVVGLVGQNGSGKTTLLRHLIGLTLPTSGTCTTLEVDSAELGPEQLSRIGAVSRRSPGSDTDWRKNS